MKKKNEKNIGAKAYTRRAGWMWLFLILIALLTILYINFVNEMTYKNVYKNITEISEQTATQLNLSITEQENFVQMMVDSISRGYFKTPQDIFDRFDKELEHHHFTRLVILDKNGNGVTSDGHVVQNYTNIGEFFKQEEVYLSENRPSTVSDNQVNIYSKTFTLNGEELVLMGTINTEDYKEILVRRLFGKGGTYLINNDGSILINSFEDIKEDSGNLYNYIINRYELKDEENVNKIIKMSENIKRKEEGTFDVRHNNTTYFVHYEKININDWYIVTVAANDTIAKEFFTVLVATSILFLGIYFVVVIAVLYIDISNYKKSRNLYKVAYIDPITELGNESYFRENAAVFLEEDTDDKYIITMDINKFKALNNIHGYEFCNSILKTMGKKMLKVLPEKNITSRISNDVFATIFSYDKEINVVLDKLIKEVSDLKVENIDIHVNLSVGVYKVKTEDKDINQILDKAYMARAEMKGLYHQNYYIFDEKLENQLVEEQKIESTMEKALENNEFKVVYQPKMYAKSETISGAEALVRWQTEDGMVPPGKFISLFEKNKFILKLDLYVFKQACSDIASWKEMFGFQPVVSINVSKEHFINERFIDEYVEIADQYKLDRSKIDLEITESATMDDNINILKILNNIKEKGFMISIDDFGTGYSSLSMLQNMPIDVIKIDKVFVDKADLSSSENIINYIMYLAKRLEVKTIVEGVETKEQVDFMKKLNCDVIQGYYYSKPIPKEEFEEYVKKYI